MRMTTFCGSLVAVSALLVVVAVLSTSFARVNDDEMCELFYPDGVQRSNVQTRTSAGIVFVGPGVEKHCVTRATQHLTFDGRGLGGRIAALSQEGVPVVLEIDIEFRLNPARFSETVQRTGFDSANTRMMRTARSEMRNAASEFPIDAYLIGSRERIAERMRAVLQERLMSDRVYVTIVKVNLLHIDVDKAFEQLYQQVEDRRLQQLVALERQNLIRIDEERLNSTQRIQIRAKRNQELRAAETQTVRAALDQERRLTEAQTDFQQAVIVAESGRITRLIRAETTLSTTIATRRLSLDSVGRVAQANQSLAVTERQNMRVVAVGNISRANANATRDITQATIMRTRRLEQLISLGINRTLEMFEIRLEANVTGSEMGFDGEARAVEALGAERARTSEWRMLRDTLGLTDRALANVLFYRAMARSTNATITVDHEAVPLRLMEGPLPGQVVGNAN